NLSRVTFEFCPFAVGGQIPNLDQPVAAGCDELFSVPAEVQIKNRVAMSPPGGQQRAVRRAEEPDESALSRDVIGQRQAAAVRRELDGSDASHQTVGPLAIEL